MWEIYITHKHKYIQPLNTLRIDEKRFRDTTLYYKFDLLVIARRYVAQVMFEFLLLCAA